MPMPKPEKPDDLCIGADGLANQEGRTPKSLDIKVVKAFRDQPNLQNEMAKLADEARSKSGGSKE